MDSQAAIFDKFSIHARQSIKNAFSFAVQAGHKYISPGHLLLGVVLQKGSVGHEILNKAKVENLKLKHFLCKKYKRTPNIQELLIDKKAQSALEKAVTQASINNHLYIGTEHLLSGVFDSDDQVLTEFFALYNIQTKAIRSHIETALNGVSKFKDLTTTLETASSYQLSDDGMAKNALQHAPSLEHFALHLTDPNIQTSIDPVIGRDSEIERLIQIISRRQKNNPILLGEPGVGKTAIIEGLAKKIALNQVPAFLANKKIYSLDMAALLAGTNFRGEFEQRLKLIIDEARKDKNIILFIDEIHTVVGAGAATGAMDAANILKPALARGDIRCIGATTLEDYKKNIEPDSALERRFQPIIVEQPTVLQTIKILNGIKSQYELFHNIKIHPQAITAAAELSERYIPERFLPDKAIDIIDEAAARAKITHARTSKESPITKLEKKQLAVTQKKIDKIISNQLLHAAVYQEKELELAQQISTLTQSLEQQENVQPEITADDITAVVASITKIPLHELQTTEKEQLLKLENKLSKKIVGQTSAIKKIAECIRRSRTGVHNTNRPNGSFLFLGPPGVGKTELAKVLAREVFGSEKALIRIDMSEFAESFSSSKLIGAPAGYVGYREHTKLTDPVKQRPYSVVLFDEIEKAHPQTFNILLQVLDEGFLTDSTGKKINFKNTIIILTSNIGTQQTMRTTPFGFEQQATHSLDVEMIKKKVNEVLMPEFINRLDHVIVFEQLKEKELIKIAQMHLRTLKQRLKQRNIDIHIDPQIAKEIVTQYYQPHVGARTIQKAIQNSIESHIAQQLLRSNKQRMTISVSNVKSLIRQ